ncbi:MAG: hypothetical protein K2M76_02790, partial [Muribaculaceae bacterium]|nr:hypothetical protein [Muribaculaceae bacterium]
FFTTACHKHDEPKPEARTILVYMVANNSLGHYDYDSDDITEMLTAAKAKAFNNGRLIVYRHRYNASQAELIEVTADGLKTLKNYDINKLSVSSERMSQVFADMKRLAPNEHYGLILWSHGSGWLENGVETASSSGISPLAFGDDERNGSENWMNTSVLAQLTTPVGFDFIYFDCCYMGGIEVMYEMRNSTPYIVSSPTELPAYGMPYHKNLPLLFQLKPDLVGAAKNTFETYPTNTYMDVPCSMVVIDCAAINDLAIATKSLYSRAVSLSSGYAAQYLSSAITCYYFDWEDYVKNIAASESDFTTWQTALNNAILYKATSSHVRYIPITRFGGLSTYI